MECQDPNSSHQAEDLGCETFGLFRLHLHQSEIDLGMSKSKLKLSNDFSLVPKMLKILFLLSLHRIQSPKVVCMHLFDSGHENEEI